MPGIVTMKIPGLTRVDSFTGFLFLGFFSVVCHLLLDIVPAWILDFELAIFMVIEVNFVGGSRVAMRNEDNMWIRGYLRHLGRLCIVRKLLPLHGAMHVTNLYLPGRNIERSCLWSGDMSHSCNFYVRRENARTGQQNNHE